MPTYEYKCEYCDHQFEIMQSFRDKVLEKCPECGNDSLKKLISSNIGVIFKGSGFYCTDYKSSNKPPRKGKKNDKNT